jgi:hypothetical protein
MLFSNIDHLDAGLVPMTRVAGYQFFVGASALDMLFAHMEMGSGTGEGHSPELQQHASLAAWHAAHAESGLDKAAARFLDLAQLVTNEFSHINEDVKAKAPFADAARRIDIPPDSPIVHQMSDMLYSANIEGVLTFLANDIHGIAQRVGILGGRILQSMKVQDYDYDEAHLILGVWHPLLVRGQFLSSVCYLAARVAA